MLLSEVKTTRGDTLQYREIRTDAVGVSTDKQKKGISSVVAGWETE